jgi:protoporphyrinogen IX oxidase
LSAWLVVAYPWVKSLHILSVIAWMAGLLYLPRLYVYHAMAPVGSDSSETFKVMERRLQHGIMTPAMIGTWLFGLILLYLASTSGIVDWHMEWIWAKLALVLALTGYDHVLVRWRKSFAVDCNAHSPRFFRIVNEIPTVALIAIVVLVVVKPF